MIGRFVPFVRTYITVVAGVTRMERKVFLKWSAIGAVLWVFTITLLGYFLGTTVPVARREHRLRHAGDPRVHRGAVRLRVVAPPRATSEPRPRMKVTTDLELPQPVDATDKP